MDTSSGPRAGTHRGRPAWQRRAAVLQWRANRLDPVLRALMWSFAAGLGFTVLNALMRALAQQMHPFQTQLLRYVCGLLVLLPIVLSSGFAAFRPRNIGGQFARGAVHTAALCLWFTAVPHITLAETTAIGFTGPIFIMLGAALVLRERMRWERWVAAGVGFVGVLIVVAPQLTRASGPWTLVMLASSPVFAASFLITKALTRYERPSVIVLWQSITVALLTLPLALPHWTHVSALQWLAFMACGVLGSVAHYCLARSYSIADISATQSLKFLDLVWAAALGWLVFADVPSRSTLVGGVVICAATMWITRREARTRQAAQS